MLIGNTRRYSIVTLLFRLPAKYDLGKLLDQKHMFFCFHLDKSKKNNDNYNKHTNNSFEFFCNHQSNYFRNTLLLHFLPSSQSKQKGNLVTVNLSVKHLKKVQKAVGYFLSFIVWCLVWQVTFYSQQFYYLRSLSYCLQYKKFLCLVLYVNRIASQIQISNLANWSMQCNQSNCLSQWNQFPRIQNLKFLQIMFRSSQ